jgi:hypothetical protein
MDIAVDRLIKLIDSVTLSDILAKIYQLTKSATPRVFKEISASLAAVDFQKLGK